MRASKYILTALLTGAAVPCVSANVVVQPHIETRNACGFVFDEYGVSIPNASVEMRSAGGAPIQMLTDAKGRFETRTYQGEMVDVRISMSGFAPLNFKIEKVKPGPCRKTVYAMLAVGLDESMVALKRKDLPKAKR